MKLATRLLGIALIALFAALPVLAQNVGDYRTRNSGNWNMAQNWERFNGSSWALVATPPTGAETITIRAADSIFVNVAVSVSGRVVNQGRIATDGLLTIGDGGVYQHDRDAGTIPGANWGAGSTVHITGTTGTAPANRNQSYHHLVLDTPGLLSNVNMNFNGVTIGGDITLLSSGSGRWYLSSAASNETVSMTIQGDVRVEAGQFSVHGTGNALTTFNIEHYGNIIVTGGNFSISRGGQANGTTTWRLHAGDFRMSNATSQNSTLTPGGARFVFQSGATQELELAANNTLQALPIEVEAGTRLDAGTSVIGGSGQFVLAEGAMLGTGLAAGVTGMFPATHTGPLTLPNGSSYAFNGSVSQVTGTRMPLVVNDLVIDNAAGVALSQETVINGVLRLVSGQFDNTIPFTLGPNGSISNEGGSLLFPVSNEGDALAGRFGVADPYPNPFRGTTRLGVELPAASAVTITVYNVLGQRVAQVLDGTVLPEGTHLLPVDLGALGAGVYLYRVETAFGEATGRLLLVH